MKIYEIMTSARNADCYDIRTYTEDEVKYAIADAGRGMFWEEEHANFLETVGKEWVHIPGRLQDTITRANFIKKIRVIEEK